MIWISEAVMQWFDICTADISNPFLQGLTYKELAELTGESVRKANFYLPAQYRPLLRHVPGIGDLNPAVEVLHCHKPGTGLIDALRAFSFKLKGVTNNIKLKPFHVDLELCVPHVSRRLICRMSEHVDDIKLAGVR